MPDTRVDLVTAAYEVFTLPTELPRPVSAMIDCFDIASPNVFLRKQRSIYV